MIAKPTNPTIVSQKRLLNCGIISNYRLLAVFSDRVLRRLRFEQDQDRLGFLTCQRRLNQLSPGHGACGIYPRCVDVNPSKRAKNFRQKWPLVLKPGKDLQLSSVATVMNYHRRITGFSHIFRGKPFKPRSKDRLSERSANRAKDGH